MGRLCFGVDLGGTAIKLGLFDSEDGLLESWEIVTRKEEGGSLILDDISVAILKKIEERKISKEEILGVGIGVPGPVTSDGYVNSCVNFFIIKNFLFFINLFNTVSRRNATASLKWRRLSPVAFSILSNR